MLDGRKAAILRAIVREYVRSGLPVSSKTLGQKYRLKVSAATIRNDMVVLEELGYIHQPHTSAGRVPTDLGYRWFVDSLEAPWPELPERERNAIREFASFDFAGIEEALDGTSQLLSDLTHSASVVAAPLTEKNQLRRLELLRRDSRRATLLLIADNGVVEQGVVEFGSDKEQEDLDSLAAQLNRELEGSAFEELSRTARPLRSAEGADGSSSDRARVADEIDAILSKKSFDKLFRFGAANILDPEKFNDMNTAHNVVGALERPQLLAGVVEAARNANAILVFIGTEIPVREMQSCAIVFAPYSAGPDRAGILGVVGPMRLDYPRTISAVESVARSLSDLLGSSGE